MDLRRVLAPHIGSPYRVIDRAAFHELYNYASRDEALYFEMPGRCIALQAAEIALHVSGTKDSPPNFDHGQQDALLRVATHALRDHVDFAATERWTDTPFEEPPERVRRGAEAIAFLEALTRPKARLVFELEYFAEGEAPNPALHLELSDRQQTRILQMRPRNAAQVQLVDPGTYLARALAPAGRSRVSTELVSRLCSKPRRLLYVVYAEVKLDAIRIISARKATKHEKAHYEND
jgi:hypothetical protein